MIEVRRVIVIVLCCIDSFLVLSADDASLIALELGLNPVVDERQALDLFPAYVNGHA